MSGSLGRSRMLRPQVAKLSGGWGGGFCVSLLPKSPMWSGFLGLRRLRETARGSAFRSGFSPEMEYSGARRSGFSSCACLLRGSGSTSRSFFGSVGQHLANLAREIGKGKGLLDERHARSQHLREKLAAISAHVEYFRLGAK